MKGHDSRVSHDTRGRAVVCLTFCNNLPRDGGVQGEIPLKRRLKADGRQIAIFAPDFSEKLAFGHDALPKALLVFRNLHRHDWKISESLACAGKLCCFCEDLKPLFKFLDPCFRFAFQASFLKM